MLHMSLKRTKIFTGNANPHLAEAIAEHIRIKLGRAEVSKFNDSEIRVEIHEHIRGDDIFIIQPTCGQVNDSIMELLIMADAVRRSAVNRITAVVPYYGYSRQDRRPNYTRTPITSRLVADMLEAAGIDQIITVDLHSTQQQGFFTIPVINVGATPEIVGDIWRTQVVDPKDVIIVSPDVGGVVRARAVAKQINNADLAIIDKRRPQDGVSEVMNVVGDVEGKVCIVVDDMIDTAGTLCKGAGALKERGAKKIVAYATHGVLSGSASNNIQKSVIDEVVVCNTIPVSPLMSKKVRQISVAKLLGETIRRLQTGQSVSQIYTGE